MNDLSLNENLADAEEILGEVASLLEVEGKGGLLLARRARQAHERLKGWQEHRAGGKISIGKSGADELRAICVAQHAALERIASGVHPSRGDRGLTMLTVREARAIAQSALHLYEGQPTGREESGRSPAQEAERLRARVLSSDLQGAKRQAQMILERDEVPDAVGQDATLNAFAQTLSDMLEGRGSLDVRHAAASSLVRREQEARQAAERSAQKTEREAAELRQTLAWYAEKANYLPVPGVREQETPETAAEHDQGRRARQTLDSSEGGLQVARRLEAAEKLIEHLKVDLRNYEQEIAQTRA